MLMEQLSVCLQGQPLGYIKLQVRLSRDPTRVSYAMKSLHK